MSNYFVYFLYDYQNTLLYIGKTNNIKERLTQHLLIKSIELDPWKKQIDYKNTILYSCINKVDLELYETYFINKYKPLYNKDKVYDEVSTFDLPYIEPYNPFYTKLNKSLSILNKLSKVNQDEYKSIAKKLNLNHLFLSKNDQNVLYLNENKFRNFLDPQYKQINYDYLNDLFVLDSDSVLSVSDVKQYIKLHHYSTLPVSKIAHYFNCRIKNVRTGSDKKPTRCLIGLNFL